MYIGCARNSRDIERALALAAETFRSGEDPDAAISIKRLLVSQRGMILEQDVVILANKPDEVQGTCFLIDRFFFRGSNKLKGTFLTSICITESSRGKGFSALLMNHAIAECERRDSAFAILIARRAVDYFYNKFNFWGLSQYSKININLKGASASSNRFALYPATEGDLASINCLYEHTYSALLGSCERSVEYWRHVLWKTRQQNNTFVVFRIQDVVCGYAIFSGSEIHEVASNSDVLCLDLLHHLGDIYSLTDVTLNCSPQHRIANELHSFDFSVTQRQCAFGGHMVRVINHEVLLKIWEEELRETFLELNSKSYLGVSEDFMVEFAGDKVSVTLNSLPFSYRNTCNLMRASYLSASQSTSSIFKHRSFNVPLVDQS